MAIIRKDKRPKKAGKRLDLSAMREALADGKVWAQLGLVVEGTNGSAFEIDTDEGDILIEVELMPNEERLSCRLGAVAGGAGRGIWAVPPIGTEVAVLVPDGFLEAEPIIVATLSSGSIVSTEGVAENRTIIINDQVWIHDGNGGANPLPTLAEFKAHVHPTGTGPSGVPSDPIPAHGPITGTVTFRTK